MIEILILLLQDGSELFQIPFDAHPRTAVPIRVKSSLQAYAAVDPKVVLEKLTEPPEISGRSPQSSAVKVYKRLGSV